MVGATMVIGGILGLYGVLNGDLFEIILSLSAILGFEFVVSEFAWWDLIADEFVEIGQWVWKWGWALLLEELKELMDRLLGRS